MNDLQTVIEELNTGKIEFDYKDDGCCTTEGEVVILLKRLAELENADVEEVKRAKWEINCDGYYPFCSNCKTEPENGVMSKRCPECGAKMDGGKTK